MRPTRWLGWLIPEAERECVLGDLDEAYGGRRSLHCLADLLSVAWALRFNRPRPVRRIPLTPRRGDFIMTTLGNDIRYALRQLGRSPGFTLLSILTLALGIGATTAMFSVVNPILLEPLPYPNPDRIVALWEREKDGSEDNTGYLTFLDIQRMATSFDGIAVTSQWQPTLQGRGDPERLNGQRVTQRYFSILGVHPALGHDFTAEENIRGRHRVTILSHGLWQRRFGGDSAIVGRSVSFDGIQYTVVGVMPKSFESLLAPGAQLWAPLGYEPSLPFACRTCHHLREVARLNPGISPERARTELDLLFSRLVAEHPTEYSGVGMYVVPLRSQVTRDVRPALLAVLGAVGFVLLIACANVSGLLLGRALQREGEFAIRGALGAGRGRVVRQLLTESILLGLVGGAAGALLAWGGIRGLVALGPASLPRLSAISIDARALGFTAALSIATGLLFGLVPALATARPDLFTALRPGGRHSGQRSRRLARAVLVVGEVGLALMLLVGAGLLMRSLGKLLAVNPGFEPKGLLTMEVQTTGARYGDNAATWAFFDRAMDAVKAVPGVEIAGWTSQLPLGGDFDRYGVQIEGKLLANPEDAPSADRYAVSADYIRAMRIPLRRGRGFTAQDGPNAPRVALINETFARLSWAGEDPIGERVQAGGPETPWRTVVGIVGDVHHVGLDETQAPQLYIPESQWLGADGAMVLAARVRGDPLALIPTVRAALQAVDPSLPILRPATMEQVVSATTQPRRFAFVLFQAFALVALLLAAAGIYGVLAGSVTERTKELGIRAALGASRNGLVSLVVRQGLGLAAAGMAVGSAGAVVLSRFLQRLLFGIGPRDPITFAAVVAVLLGVALVACWAPAWRATRVSPLEALRGE